MNSEVNKIHIRSLLCLRSCNLKKKPYILMNNFCPCFDIVITFNNPMSGPCIKANVALKSVFIYLILLFFFFGKKILKLDNYHFN